jgi:hypothetical protein
MVTETHQSSNSRPEETRRAAQFCGNPYLDGRDSDLTLKPNVTFIKTHLSSDRETEDLIEMAQRKADKLNFRGIKINSRWAAMAVLAGIQ